MSDSTNTQNEKRSCYCEERNNPKMQEFFLDIPEGFCGICDICGEYGHLNAHPHLPTSGTWCDKHYQELCTARVSNLGDVLAIGIFIFVGAMGIYYAFYA